MRSEPDQVLVRRCLDGDPGAFDGLVRRHEQRVYVIAYGRVLDHGHAQDVTQDTFLRAYQRLGQLRHPDRFRTWLCRIALSVSLNSLRRRGKEAGLMGEDESLATIAAPSVDQLTLERSLDMRQIVEDALASLPGSLRIPVTLRFMDDASTNSIAESLAISPSNAHTRIWRGIERLRAYFRDRDLDVDCLDLLRKHALSAPIAAQVAQTVMESVRDAGPPRSDSASPLTRLGHAAGGAVLTVGVLTGAVTGALTMWGSLKGARAPAPEARLVSAAVVRSTSVSTPWPRRPARVLVQPGNEWAGWEPAAPQNATTLPTMARNAFRSPPAGAAVSNDHGVIKRFPASEGVITVETWIQPALGDANTSIQIVPEGMDDYAFSLVFKNETDRWGYGPDSYTSVFFANVEEHGHDLKVVYTTATATWDIYLDGTLMVEGVERPRWRGWAMAGVVLVCGNPREADPTYFDDLRVTVTSPQPEVRATM